jgi:glycosyltransferase involved in cell wall biosynthesis
VKLSVIVPAFNEERLLPATLVNLKERVPPFELIVCDNNSTDRTAEIARAAGATVVFEPVNQISRARNRGGAAATGEWLLFVDADSLPGRELLRETLEAIASGRCLAPAARRWSSSRATSWCASGWRCGTPPAA